MSKLHEAEAKPKDMDRERLPFGRLWAVDLRQLTEEQMSTLRMEAIRRGTSMPELLGELVDDVSKRIMGTQPEARPQ